MSKCMIIDLDRCWGCKSCQMACKREHGWGPGPEYCIEVARVEGINQAGELQCDFLPVGCMHCDDAACIEACPVRAISRDERGAVILDQDKCIGCGKCERACAYGAVSVYKPEQGGAKAYKCDLCRDRVARGLPPSCVQHCIGTALIYCEEEEVAQKTQGHYHWSVGRVHYISTKLDRLGAMIE